VAAAILAASSAPALAEAGGGNSDLYEVMRNYSNLTGAPPAKPQAIKQAEAEITGSISAGHGARALTASGETRGRYASLIARHAAAAGVPYKLADAVVRIESRYNPSVSHGGAVGLMQIKPQTARGLGYSGGAGGLMNPETNLRYGMLYLAQAYRMAGGDTCGTVMRYQSGHYATRFSGANRAYCGKARAIMASAS
jgi:soluble lytic murein transglycosylase-like protein